MKSRDRPSRAGALPMRASDVPCQASVKVYIPPHGRPPRHSGCWGMTCLADLLADHGDRGHFFRGWLPSL